MQANAVHVIMKVVNSCRRGVGPGVEDLMWHCWRVWRALGFQLSCFGAVSRFVVVVKKKH